MKRVLSVSLAFIVATCVGALAQKPVERAGDVSKTATITAINHSTRVVTLKDDQGHLEDILCGPDFKQAVEKCGLTGMIFTKVDPDDQFGMV